MKQKKIEKYKICQNWSSIIAHVSNMDFSRAEVIIIMYLFSLSKGEKEFQIKTNNIPRGLNVSDNEVVCVIDKLKDKDFIKPIK